MAFCSVHGFQVYVQAAVYNQGAVHAAASQGAHSTPPSHFEYFAPNFNGSFGGYDASQPAGRALADKFWDETLLREAALVESPRQLQPLLSKLRRGEPVSVMAWGSSVTADYGGCFNPGSVDYIRARVKRLPKTHAVGLCHDWTTQDVRSLGACMKDDTYHVRQNE